MGNQSSESLDRAIAATLRFYPMTRKIQREILARGQQKAGVDIAYHHAVIMITLQEHGVLSSSELGGMICVSKAQMTHSTDKLADMGLVEKQQDAVDRRKVIIRLTPKGEATVKKIDEVMLDFIHEQLSSLSNEELEKLAESFDNIIEVFSK